MNIDLTSLEISVLIVDALILQIIAFCLWHNSMKIYRATNDTMDIQFRSLMFLLCINFLVANSVALERHIDLVFYGAGFADGTVKSLLWDRGFMMSSSIIIYLLSWKYKTFWYI